MREGSRAAKERILAAAYECVARYGLAKTTVEDVAREAGISRATVHRHFQGGKEELVRAVIAWELRHFFTRLAGAVQGATTLAEVCELALLFAHRSIDEHVVLQTVLRAEPKLLVPRLTAEANRLQPFITEFLEPYVGAEVVRARTSAGTAPHRAADHLGRMLLSVINGNGRWDLSDPEQVRACVHDLTAGIVSGGIVSGGIVSGGIVSAGEPDAGP